MLVEFGWFDMEWRSHDSGASDWPLSQCSWSPHLLTLWRVSARCTTDCEYDHPCCGHFSLICWTLFPWTFIPIGRFYPGRIFQCSYWTFLPWTNLPWPFFHGRFWRFCYFLKTTLAHTRLTLSAYVPYVECLHQILQFQPKQLFTVSYVTF